MYKYMSNHVHNDSVGAAMRAVECSECGLDSTWTRCFQASILDSKTRFSQSAAVGTGREAQSSASRTCLSSGTSHPIFQNTIWSKNKLLRNMHVPVLQCRDVHLERCAARDCWRKCFFHSLSNHRLEMKIGRVNERTNERTLLQLHFLHVCMWQFEKLQEAAASAASPRTSHRGGTLQVTLCT